jgi:hypothetical protein
VYLDVALPSGIWAYEAGIERTIATIPAAANKQMKVPAIQIGTRTDRSQCVEISIPFGVR